MTNRCYLSVASTLRDILDSGRWQVGERLPAERQLTEELDVPRATVREALIGLDVEGRVEVRQMSGVYARPQATSAMSEPLLSPVQDIGPFELLRARQVVESAIAAARRCR